MRASESIEEIKQITSESKRQRTSSGEEKNCLNFWLIQ
jgi:hypothetical protein